MNFAETLEHLLLDRDLKQADLCRMTGIQTSLISEYIGGKKSPTIGNAIKIADALKISLDALVGKEELPHEPLKGEASDAVDALVEQIISLSREEQKLLFTRLANRAASEKS